jgi:hypothetical protein
MCCDVDSEFSADVFDAWTRTLENALAVTKIVQQFVASAEKKVGLNLTIIALNVVDNETPALSQRLMLLLKKKLLIIIRKGDLGFSLQKNAV